MTLALCEPFFYELPKGDKTMISLARQSSQPGNPEPEEDGKQKKKSAGDKVGTVYAILSSLFQEGIKDIMLSTYGLAQPEGNAARHGYKLVADQTKLRDYVLKPETEKVTYTAANAWSYGPPRSTPGRGCLILQLLSMRDQQPQNAARRS